MKATRRRFSREFKLEAVRQMAAGSRLADVARALGVDAQVVRRWQQQVARDPATAFPGNGRPPELRYPTFAAQHPSTAKLRTRGGTARQPASSMCNAAHYLEQRGSSFPNAGETRMWAKRLWDNEIRVWKPGCPRPEHAS